MYDVMHLMYHHHCASAVFATEKHEHKQKSMQAHEPTNKQAQANKQAKGIKQQSFLSIAILI